MKPDFATASTLVGPTATAMFAIVLSSTWRGARLARLLVVQQLESWGVPFTAPTSQRLAAVTAELAANVVQHARRPGKDFGVRVVLHPRTVRLEVVDARPEWAPRPPVATPSPEAVTGRGLVLVEALADRWGWGRCGDALKVVWAELQLPVAGGPADVPGPDPAPGSG